MRDSDLRREEILNLLKKKGVVTTEDIQETVFASISTIRRDLMYLEKNNAHVKRVWGGAAFLHEPEERSIQERKLHNVAEKQLIVAEAVKLITEKTKTIFIDSSSTCYYLASALTQIDSKLNIISNGLITSQELAKYNHHNVISTGGNIHLNSSTLFGPITQSSIEQFYADICFLSAKGLANGYFLENSLEEAYVKQNFVYNSRLTVVLLDSSKFNKNSSARSLSLDKIDYIISDSMPPQEIREALLENSVELIIAG